MLHDGGQVRSTLATSQSLGFVARGASAEAAPGAVAVEIFNGEVGDIRIGPSNYLKPRQ